MLASSRHQYFAPILKSQNEREAWRCDWVVQHRMINMARVGVARDIMTIQSVKLGHISTHSYDLYNHPGIDLEKHKSTTTN
jgi:hypothetical protein